MSARSNRVSSSRASRRPRTFRIYAIGDVHGRLDLLNETFKKIDDHWLAAPSHRSVEVTLGDYVDRGPESKGVIDRLIKRSLTKRSEAHRLVCLKGNHEQLLLDALDDPWLVKPWLSVGGGETLESYGVRAPLSESTFAAAARAFASTIPDAHRHFLSGLQPGYECGDYFFVHAGVRPGIPISEQSPKDLMWIREPFLSSQADFGKRVVHGHTPSPTPDVRPNRINIDTGAFATGRLTCLVIDGEGLRFL